MLYGNNRVSVGQPHPFLIPSHIRVGKVPEAEAALGRPSGSFEAESDVEILCVTPIAGNTTYYSITLGPVNSKNP